MAERPEDLNLPNAVVSRLVKEALPEGVNIAKEAKSAIAKAASVFVLYVTSCANNIATKNNRKTINGQDVIQAMQDIEFEKFVEPLQEAWESFKKNQKEKREVAAKNKQQKEERRKSEASMEEDVEVITVDDIEND